MVAHPAFLWRGGGFHSKVEIDLGYAPQGAKLAYMSGQTLQKYMLPLAAGVQAVFTSSGLSNYRHADWLGTSRLSLDTGGNLYVARSYAPFGEAYNGITVTYDLVLRSSVTAGPALSAGVCPSSFLSAGSAPASSRACAISRSSWAAAA
jgi:hypothetical protein